LNTIFSATLRKVLRFESATERERQLAAQTIAGGKEKSPSRQMPTQLIHPADDDESGVFKLECTFKF
jgi:hypothetical protein